MSLLFSADAKCRRESYAMAMGKIVKSVDIDADGPRQPKSPPPVSTKPKLDTPPHRPPKPDIPPPQVPKRKEWLVL